MKPSKYKELEVDQLFKRHYLNKIIWWKDFLLVAPALLIFIGIAGVIYMGQNDNLWNWYSVPYIAVLIIGSIWLKAIKKHLQKKLLDDKDKFQACAARAIGDKGGYYYFIFSTGSKRHNETLINQLAESLDINSISEEQLSASKKQMVEISTMETETTIYMKAISVNRVLKTNRENIRTGVTPLLYISPKDIFVIRRKDLVK